ncbi:hypothetical protein [Clavibacter sp. Sh2126]|uniref:hypothetical protein n=1 Tax=Clavibacter sp. Sh2126 TaxID=3397678 RepID=UPI0039E14B40
MAKKQEEVLRDFATSCMSIAMEFSEGAPALSKIYVYVGSERGHSYANAFFEQRGEVVYANDLRGVDSSDERVSAVQRYLLNYLADAEVQFEETGAPLPTQYRLTYDLDARQLDMQLSHELVYSNHPTKILEEGAEDWLDGRLEKMFG